MIFRKKILEKCFKNRFSINVLFKNITNQPKYIQGQLMKEKSQIREYFYYIDHQGYLFLDDSKMKNFTSCYKEKNFLEFFFNKLQLNSTKRYEDDFYFLSKCGYERNYVRCDDYPIVFTHLIENKFLIYNHGNSNLKINFEPHNIYMCTVTGRIYHPANKSLGGIGLIRSKLAIELSKNFIFEDEKHDKVLMNNFIETNSENLKENEKLVLNVFKNKDIEEFKNNNLDEPKAFIWNEEKIKLSQKIKPILIKRLHFLNIL